MSNERQQVSKCGDALRLGSKGNEALSITDKSVCVWQVKLCDPRQHLSDIETTTVGNDKALYKSADFFTCYWPACTYCRGGETSNGRWCLPSSVGVVCRL